MRNPFVFLANFSVGKVTRWIVIGVWIALAVVLTLATPKLSTLDDNSATSSIGDQESVRAGKLLQEAFPGESKNAVPAIIVFSNPNGLTAQDNQKIDTVTCWLLSDAQRAKYNCASDAQAATRPAEIGSVVAPLTVPQAKSQLLSSDGTTLTVVATINAPTNDPTAIVKQVRAYTQQYDGVDGLQVKVTGPAGIATDLTGVFANINVTILVTTVLLVLVLLLLIYRSPLLALLPLVVVGVVLQIVDPITALFVKAGAFSVNAQATGVRDVLLFGAGTDYVIFLVARYREELEGEQDRFRRAAAGDGRGERGDHLQRGNRRAGVADPAADRHRLLQLARPDPRHLYRRDAGGGTDARARAAQRAGASGVLAGQGPPAHRGGARRSRRPRPVGTHRGARDKAPGDHARRAASSC